MLRPREIPGRGVRWLLGRASRVAARSIPRKLAAQAFRRSLFVDPEWLPEAGVALSFALAERLRALEDASGGNRWLHHRWLGIYDELWSDLAGEEVDDGFVYVCMGAGTRNPLAFPLLMFLGGASEVWVIEPERVDPDERWRIYWGLQEMVLRLLGGSARPTSRAIDVGRLVGFVDLGPLLFGRDGERGLNQEHVHLHWTPLEETPIPGASVDLLTSRAVLEHVERPDVCLDALARIMRAGGLMYHDVDLTAHSTHGPFELYYRDSHPGLNGWRLSDWRDGLEERGFDTRVVRAERAQAGALDRGALAPRFTAYSEDDLLVTRSVIVAAKRR